MGNVGIQKNRTAIIKAHGRFNQKLKRDKELIQSNGSFPLIEDSLKYIQSNNIARKLKDYEEMADYNCQKE